jgi:hypothetical protein
MDNESLGRDIQGMRPSTSVISAKRGSSVS